ncbi:DUF4041 domain-containing protein [Helcococcus bovis]|uniref:DUF4041 domain-containing protein n=1 Tax=Helcococcus bovis TaxID=3153252 RepID=UPI0038B85854
MGILDFLNAKKYKDKIFELENNLNLLTVELEDVNKKTALELKADIINKEKIVSELKSKVTECDRLILEKTHKLNVLKKELIVIEEDIEMESFSLYRPRYDFVNSIKYKEKLDIVRANQKTMIKDKTAVSYFDNWTVDGSKQKGRKMTNDNIKQILRSFNNECEAAINKVKFNNISTIENRIYKSYEQLNKLNETNKVSISYSYLEEKIKELHLAYEYEKKKQEEKEELREQREREREEKKLQEEINRKKKNIDKDITHFKNVLDELYKKLKNLKNVEERKAIEDEILDINNKIQEKEEEKQELDYRSANATAGYVYIISNIGAFGENIFKIGVTRRLDPYERIAELSSASVPFKFDIHALIFSYEAYQLETALHTKFEKNRVNAINNRKEFYNITLEDIKKTLEEYKNLTFDFNEIAEAEEYRQTLKLKEKQLIQ